MEEMTESDAEEELQNELEEADGGDQDDEQRSDQTPSQGEREPLLRNRRK